MIRFAAWVPRVFIIIGVFAFVPAARAENNNAEIQRRIQAWENAEVQRRNLAAANARFNAIAAQIAKSPPPSPSTNPPPSPPPLPRPSGPPDEFFGRGRDQSSDLVIDLNTGIAAGAPANARSNLTAFSFALNSINTTLPKLFRAEDALKEAFPPKGDIPATGPARIRIPLGDYLSQAQIGTLQTALRRDPLVCNPNELSEGFRPDLFVRNVLGSESYYSLMSLSDSRAPFERAQGIGEEFGPRAERDQSTRTTRVVLEPGESGVAHPEGYRGLVLQTSSTGGIVARTLDFDRENATKDQAHLQAFPVSAQPDASEEIWELPNGFRGYALRAGNGTLQKSAPITVVSPRIVNPVSCMRCHSDGFIATTGKSGSHALANLTPVRVLNESGIGKSLYRASFQEYQEKITAGNFRYQAAIRQSGAASGKSINTFLSDYADDVTPTRLAAELGTTVAELRTTILGDVTLRRTLNGAGWSRPDPAQYPSIPRASLERSTVNGGGRTSTFCALKGRLIEEARGRRNQTDEVATRPPARTLSSTTTH